MYDTKRTVYIMTHHGAFVRNIRIITNYMKRSDKKYRISYISNANEINLYKELKDNFSYEFAFRNNLNQNDFEYFDIGLFAEYYKYSNSYKFDIKSYLSKIDNHTAVSFTTSLQETNKKQVEKDFHKLCAMYNFHATINLRINNNNSLHISSICWKLNNKSSLYRRSSISRMFKRPHFSKPKSG